MQKIQVICVGRLKEKYYADACAEYVKRLGRYCDLVVAELPETGDMDLAETLRRCAGDGTARVCFLIGGSDGLSKRVKERADETLSMSRMVFPHHLARVMLLEQIYRAYTILNGGKYHK